MAQPRRSVPLILDVDTGIDDSLALLYACASPEAEIVAVTCSAGNVDARQVAENTRGVLELAGRPDVEVAVGREAPLLRELVTTPETHGPRGIGWAELPPPVMPLSPRRSPELIVEEARRRPGEITLVTLAPLTNVAIAALREPELPRLLRRLVIMGGAYRVPGNTTPVSEWNVHVDPDAARIVFGAWARAVEADMAAGRGETAGTGVARTSAEDVQRASWGNASPTAPRALAIGLDVTEQARLLPRHLGALADRAGTAAPALEARVRSGDAPPAENPVLRYLADALRFYMEFHATSDHFYGAFTHDPFVVAAALDDRLVRTEPVAVDVETGGAISTGQTVADWRHLWGRPANADVAVEGDADAFLERLVDRVGALAARRG